MEMGGGERGTGGVGVAESDGWGWEIGTGEWGGWRE